MPSGARCMVDGCQEWAATGEDYCYDHMLDEENSSHQLDSLFTEMILGTVNNVGSLLTSR
jgi:hypothetical protein